MPQFFKLSLTKNEPIELTPQTWQATRKYCLDIYSDFEKRYRLIKYEFFEQIGLELGEIVFEEFDRVYVLENQTDEDPWLLIQERSLLTEEEKELAKASQVKYSATRFKKEKAKALLTKRSSSSAPKLGPSFARLIEKEEDDEDEDGDEDNDEEDEKESTRPKSAANRKRPFDQPPPRQFDLQEPQSCLVIIKTPKGGLTMVAGPMVMGKFHGKDNVCLAENIEETNADDPLDNCRLTIGSCKPRMTFLRGSAHPGEPYPKSYTRQEEEESDNLGSTLNSKYKKGFIGRTREYGLEQTFYIMMGFVRTEFKPEWTLQNNWTDDPFELSFATNEQYDGQPYSLMLFNATMNFGSSEFMFLRVQGSENSLVLRQTRDGFGELDWNVNTDSDGRVMIE